MLTRGAMREALQKATKVSLDPREAENKARDDNPSVVHKLSGRWSRTHLMGGTLTG
jgi:hypothetical protein